MRRFLFIAMALFAGGGLSVHAQTATDLNEGVRVTADAATGAQVLTWWRKAGRTYFVQQSYDLITWTYVPVVRSGTVGVVDGLNFSSTDARQFWRLKYTDASLGGLSASAADFDHDGLTNQQELNLGTDPFNADTDEDGWNDSLEKTVGSNGANAASTPPGVNPNFINLIRSYDVQTLEASENYWMDWFSTGRPPGQAWSFIHHWYLPGDVSYSTGKSADKPTVTFYGFPFTALLIDSAWQTSGSLSSQGGTLPDYANNEADFYPTASMSVVDAYSSATYKNESAGWHCRWYRYRLHLSETLPYDYSESYLAITHEYGPNPDYGQGGDHTNERWMHTGIREVTPVTFTIPAGARTGAWKSQSPTANGAGNYVAVQMVQLGFVVTNWAPVINQPLEPYTTAWGNRNPPENQPDDEAFVAKQPEGIDTFVINAGVKLKPLPLPAAALAAVASEWKIAILQDIYALPTPDYQTYSGPPGGAGSYVTTLSPVPGMDALSFPPTSEFPDPAYPNPDDQFPFRKFVTGTESLSLQYSDTPEPAAFSGVPSIKMEKPLLRWL